MYVDPGYYGNDTLDDSSTLNQFFSVTPVDGDGINVNAPAYTRFNMSYNLRDSANNVAVPKYRTVIIQDATPPVIHPLGTCEYLA